MQKGFSRVVVQNEENGDRKSMQIILPLMQLWSMERKISNLSVPNVMRASLYPRKSYGGTRCACEPTVWIVGYIRRLQGWDPGWQVYYWRLSVIQSGIKSAFEKVRRGACKRQWDLRERQEEGQLFGCKMRENVKPSHSLQVKRRDSHFKRQFEARKSEIFGRKLELIVFS